ncbi:MAG: DUF5602 domain-containing protein [Gemmatimonadaceae bacterium]
MYAIISTLLFRPRHTTLRLVSSVAVATVAATGCSKESTSPAGARLVYGPAQTLGQGTARTYIALDNAGTPVSLGVALSEAAMTGLPSTPMPGMPSAAMLSLGFPAEAENTGFDHVMLDWNPAGHEPDHVYTHPHFDFHFYQITQAQRNAIVPSNPQYRAKTAALPTADYIPAGYVALNVLANIPAAAAGVPLMGLHWLDASSPELQPPPNGKTFTTTFIYGSYDGTFIFLEPMITKAYIESMKTKPEGVSFPIGVAQKVARAGTYPNAYSIRYDAAAREYRIAMDGLTQRQ